MNFKDFIRNNNSIVKTLFHVNDDSIVVINDNTRIITKNYRTAKIFMFMPLLKEILEELLKDVSTIQMIITETFDKSKKTFNYEIKLAENKLFENITNLYKFRYYIHLNENNGKINDKPNKMQYDIGDNDFYWINCDNKETFFVIPEQNLISKNIVGNNKSKTSFKITINNILHYKSQWLTPFMFNYKTIKDETNKHRLLELLEQI